MTRGSISGLQKLYHGSVLMLRRLRRDRAFHAAVVLLLAIGIGANTLVFSLLNEVALKPLPVRDPSNLYLLERTGPDLVRPNSAFDARQLGTVVRRSPFVAAAVGEQEIAPQYVVPFRENGATRLVMAQIVTADYFRELGIRPAAGRLLDASDAAPAPTVAAVLSHAFWQSAFAGDPAAIGRTIRLKDAVFRIVGVLPPEFHSSDADRSPEIRLPLTAGPLLFASEPDGVLLQILIRLVPDATPARALASMLPALRSSTEAAELERNARRSDPEPPEAIRRDSQRSTFALRPIPGGTSRLREQFAGALWLLLGGVGGLLLAVCANTAALFSARWGERRRQFAIRVAVGASRGQILAPLLAEALLLSAGGALLGGIFAFAAAPRIAALLPPVRDAAQYAMPQLLAVRLDLHVLAFTAAAAGFTVLASGLLPAWTAASVDPLSTLKSAPGTGAAKLGGAAAIALQVAVCTLLLSAAGLAFRTYAGLDALDPGFDRAHLVEFTIDPASAGYGMEQSGAVFTELRRRVAGLPGVRSAAWAWRAVLRGSGIKTTVAPQGVVLPGTTFLNSSLNEVTPGYFDTMGLRLLAGRDLRASDFGAEPSRVVVNQAFADLFFPHQEAVGKLLVQGPDGRRAANRVIVGVVSDAKYRSMREPDPPTIYGLLPETRGSDWQLTLYLRTWGAPGTLAAAVRRTLQDLDPGVPLVEVATLDHEVRDSLWQERLVAILSAFFGVVSILLAGMGLYGALARSVARRRRELGIRSAIGARVRHIVAAVASPAVLAIACGLAAGFAASAVVLRLARALLFGVDAVDPLSYAAVAAVILLCSATGAAVPLLRALRLDPAATLRSE